MLPKCKTCNLTVFTRYNSTDLRCINCGRSMKETSEDEFDTTTYNQTPGLSETDRYDNVHA